MGAGDDDDDDDNPTFSRLGGYSMDSDDDDEEAASVARSRYELKDEDKYEDLDTEFTDGGTRLTAFNMEEENADGHFDEHGNYHEKKVKSWTGCVTRVRCVKLL